MWPINPQLAMAGSRVSGPILCKDALDLALLKESEEHKQTEEKKFFDLDASEASIGGQWQRLHFLRWQATSPLPRLLISLCALD